MQERYLGDSHDFLKYALLRHLHDALGSRLGVNWYLTRPEEVDRPGNNDGEKRHHLKGGVWQEADPELFTLIHGFEEPAARRLSNIADWELLPKGTVYFDEQVAATGRKQWHQRGVAGLADADLVFLDPDNGFEVKSMSSRTQPKYALYSEVAAYLGAGQAVIAIQFARQCDPVQRARDVRDNLIALYGGAAAYPVVRGRVAPNLLFFTIAPAVREAGLAASIRSFADKCGKAELVE